MNLYSFVLVRL